MKDLLVNYAPSVLSGCDYYRAILPVRHLAPVLKKFGVNVQLVDRLNKHEEPDCVMVHRIVDDAFVRRLAALKARGKKIIHESDDLLSHIPDWNPVKNTWEQADMDRWDAVISIADMCFVSTNQLAIEVQAINERVRVCPNLVDLNDWRGGNDHPQDKQRIRILWAGSDTHSRDLEIVIDPLRRIVKEFGSQVQLIFAGYVHPDLLVSHFKDVAHIPFVPVSRYPETMLQIKPHIALGPLQKHPFNDCKSNCKWMESTLSGAVFVASTGVEAYRGAPGYHVTTQDDWYEAIKQLIMDHDLRNKIHRDAVDEARMNWSWQKSPKINDWIESILDVMEVEYEV